MSDPALDFACAQTELHNAAEDYARAQRAYARASGYSVIPLRRLRKAEAQLFLAAKQFTQFKKAAGE
jgi:hypothetical protein